MKVAALLFVIIIIFPLQGLASGLDACAKSGSNPLWRLIENQGSIDVSSIRENFPLPESALVNSVAFGFDRHTLKLIKNGQPNDARAKAIYTAASLGRLTTTALLIAAGVSPNARIAENDDLTPLFGAVQYGCNDEVRYLIKMGANINQQTSANFTLLQLAVAEKHYDTAMLLIKLGYLTSHTDKEKVKDILRKEHQGMVFYEIFSDK